MEGNGVGENWDQAGDELTVAFALRNCYKT